jgi:hypothetical protein
MNVSNPVSDVAKKIEKLRAIFPEIPIDPGSWGACGLDLLLTMAETGPQLKQSASRVVAQKIKLYRTNETRGVSAGWHENLSGERWITLDRKTDIWISLVGVGHETFHLQQAIRKRCSVEGEYEAWRFGFSLRAELTSLGVFLPLSEDEVRLKAMPGAPTREDLTKARTLMKRIARPGYPINKAPLQGKDWQVGFIVLAVKIFNSVMRRGDLI